MSLLGQMSIVIGVTTVGTQRAMREIQLMEATVKKAQVSMMQLGRSMTQFASLPAGIFAGAALANFAKFEFSIAKIVGLVGIADEQAKAWGKDILNMSGDLGKGANELADALYYITSSGFKGAESMNILKISAQAAASGLGETKQVADIVTSAMNAYGSSVLSAAEATNVLVMAVREGKGEPEDLTRAFATVIPISAKLGVQFHEVGGALAALTRLGMPAATAATYLRQTLFTLTKPSKQTRDALKAMGTSAGELRDSLENQGLLPTLRTLGDLTERFGEESMARVFPNIRAFMGVISLLQMDVAEVNEVFENTKNSSNALNDAFAAASETLKFKLNAAVAEGQSMLIKFGEALSRSVLPIVESIGRAFKNFGDWFGGLSKDAQNFIAKILGITIAGGPLLLLLSLLKAGFNELKAVAKYIFTGGWIKGINNTTNALNNQNNAVNAQTVAVQRQTAVINANTSAKVKNNLAYTSAIVGNKNKIAGVIPKQTKVTSAVTASTISKNTLSSAKAAAEAQTAVFAKAQLQTQAAQIMFRKSLDEQIKLQSLSTKANLIAAKSSEKLAQARLFAAAAMSKQNLSDSLGLRSTNGLVTREETLSQLVKARRVHLRNLAIAQKAVNAVEEQSAVVKSNLIASLKQESILRQQEAKHRILQRKATILQIEATRLEAAAVKARTAAYQKAVIFNNTVVAASGKSRKEIRAHHRAMLAQNSMFVSSRVAANNYNKILANSPKSIGLMSFAVSKLSGIMGSFGAILTRVANFIAANWMLALIIAIAAISKYIKHLKEVNYLDTLQKKLKKEVASAVAEETSKVQTYLAIAQNEIQTKEDRNAAIERLKEIAPAYFNMLDLESIKTNKAKEAIDAYNASITKSLELKAVDQALEEEYARRKKEMLEGTFNDVSIGDKIKMYFRHIGTALLHGAGSANFGIKIAEDPKAKQWVEEAARKSEERHNKTVEYLLNERAIISSNTQDLVKNYDYLAKKSDELINRNATIQNKVKNATKEGKKEALKEQMEYQKSVKATLDLGKQTLTQLKEREEYANNLIATDNELQRLKEKGDIVGYTARLGDLQGTKNKIITEIQGKTAILEETIKSLDKVYQKGPKIVEGDNDFLGETKEKLTDIQKLWKDYDESITAILNKQNLMPEYAKSFEPVEDALKSINTLLEGFTNLSSDSFKSAIGTKQAEDVIAYYNSLQLVKNVYESTQKSQEDLFKSLEDSMDSLYNDISTIDTFDEIMTDLGMNLSYLTVKAKNMGDAFDPLNSKLTIYGKAIELIDSLVGFLTEEQKKLYDSLIQVYKALQLQADSVEVISSIEEIIEKVKALGDSAETARDRLELIAKARRNLLKGPKGENFDDTLKQLDELTEKAAKAQLALEMRNLKIDAIASFATLFGETIGKVAAGSKDAWDGLIEGLISIVKQIGSVLIGLGSWLLTIGLPIGANYLAAGIGITAIASYASASMQKRKDAKEEAEKTKVSGMALGGIVPPGYPNDSYPAMLTSGEAVIPAKRLPEFERESIEVNVVVEGVTKGSDIYYIMKEVERRYKNSF